jgi:hypothetical protein
VLPASALRKHSKCVSLNERGAIALKGPCSLILGLLELLLTYYTYYIKSISQQYNKRKYFIDVIKVQ